MDIPQLQYFVAVATDGSFSAAAARLGMTQPSLSQQVRKLERELGRPLLDRLPRGVVLTDAGKQLFDRARRLLGELADTRQQVCETSNRVSGSLAVGAIPTIAPYLLPRLVPGFVRRYPDVSLVLREDLTGRLLAAVEDGSLDVAIMSSATAPASVHLDTIATEPLLAAIPARHALARRRSVSLDQLLQQRLLVLQEMHCLAQQVNQMCLIDRSTPSIFLRGEHLATIGRLVDAGLGVSIVPRMMAKCDRSKLRVYLPLTIDVNRPIILATSLLRYRSNAMRAFVGMVKTQVEVDAKRRGR